MTLEVALPRLGLLPDVAEQWPRASRLFRHQHCERQMAYRVSALEGKQRSLEFRHDYILPTVAGLRAEKWKHDNSVTLSLRSSNREQACKVVHVSSSQIS